MRETIIREAVAASPDKVAIIFVKGHPEKDGPGASRFATTDQNGWDHVAAAWQDKDGNLVFRDMTPSKALVGPYQDDLGGAEGKRGIFGSKNGAITLDTLVQAYPEVVAIPLDLSARYGSAARAQFVDALEKELAPEKTYSFLQNGTTCSSSVGLAIASIDPEFGKFGTLDLRGVLSTSVDLIQQNFPKATAYVAQLFSDGPDALAKSIKAFIPELKLNTVAPYQVYDWAEAHRYSPEDGKLLPSGQSAPAITDTSPIELQAAHSGLAAEVAAALQHAGVPDFNNDIFVFSALAAPEASLELGDQTGQSAPAITDTSAIELQAAHSGLAVEGAAALQHAGVPDFMIENDIVVFPALAAPEASGAPGAPLELDDQSGLPLHWGQNASHIALGDPVPQQDALPAEAFLDAGLVGQPVAHHSDFLVV